MLFLTVAVLLSSPAFAFSPSESIPAEPVKRNVYVSDAVISGGDALANPVNLNGVRWAKNPAGYERVVIDLAGEGNALAAFSLSAQCPIRLARAGRPATRGLAHVAFADGIADADDHKRSSFRR